MRVAPVGHAFDNEEEVLAEAEKSACVTHDHPEGIRGAQAIAWAVFAARTGGDKPFIREEITARFGYDLGSTLADISPGYRFDVSCAGSVPQAIISFLEADDWQDAVRNAVSLGGDSDTLACMAGAVAEAFWGGIPAAVYAQMRRYLPTDFQKPSRPFTPVSPCRFTAGETGDTHHHALLLEIIANLQLKMVVWYFGNFWSERRSHSRTSGIDDATTIQGAAP